MPHLHLLQGGTENGDKAELTRLAGSDKRVRAWVAPKSSQVGDDAVIYIRGFGLFATAEIASSPIPHPEYPNRYGADLVRIQLIDPPVSLSALKRHLPELDWARYPRSIHTPSPRAAAPIRKLINRRRRSGLPDLDDQALLEASLDELRAVARGGVAAKRARKIVPVRVRSIAVKLYALLRAAGRCEACSDIAPFLTTDGRAYLEVHHMTRLADDGSDDPANVAGVCPNCHRRAHHSADGIDFNQKLLRKIRRLEASKLQSIQRRP